ncbi:MAG TPA: transglutaminase domain-containing protein [Candidatus Acetothermia bacterium]|nr:transglutaminase domain-containing protein [Candidatus Acetothermia bacterium]
MRAGRRIEVDIEYSVEVSEVQFDLSLCEYASISWELQRFLSPERHIESDAPAIKSLAAALVEGTSSPDEALWAIYNYVAENVRYSGYIPEVRGALWALENGEGDCTEFACALVVLCRAAGLPARFVEGITNVPGDEKHDWAEVYLGRVGWVPVDPTWGRFPEKRELYFARMPPNHVILTRGINLCLPAMELCDTFNYWYYEYWWEGREPRITATSDWDWLAEVASTAFRDDFSDSTGGWTEKSDFESVLAYEAGEYRMEVKRQGWMVWAWAPLSSFPADFRAELTVRPDYDLDPERAYGLIWGSGDEDFYALLFDNAGHYQLARKEQGEWQPAPLPWQGHPAISQGKEQGRIGVVVEGDTVRLLANEVMLTELEVPNLGPARVGLAVCTFNRPSAQVYFDDFTLTWGEQGG